MDNNEIIGSAAGAEVKPKKNVDRSAAYPNISLSVAFENIATVSKQFPAANQIITREDIAAVFKTTAAGIQRDVSAASQYGFLIKQKEGYSISELFRSLKNAFEKEKAKLWVDAFKTPKLYSDLIEKLDGHALPPELTIYLIRFHEIAEKAAPLAAQIFVDNAKFCGVLDENNILNVKQYVNKVSDQNFQFAEVVTVDVNNKHTPPVEVLQLQDKPKEKLFLPEINEEKLKIPLTGKKFAYLVYPNTITKKDIIILRKQLDVLDEVLEE